MRLGIVFIPLSLWISGPFISALRNGTYTHTCTHTHRHYSGYRDKHADRQAGRMVIMAQKGAGAVLNKEQGLPIAKIMYCRGKGRTVNHGSSLYVLVERYVYSLCA